MIGPGGTASQDLVRKFIDVQQRANRRMGGVGVAVPAEMADGMSGMTWKSYLDWLRVDVAASCHSVFDALAYLDFQSPSGDEPLLEFRQQVKVAGRDLRIFTTAQSRDPGFVWTAVYVDSFEDVVEICVGKSLQTLLAAMARCTLSRYDEESQNEIRTTGELLMEEISRAGGNILRTKDGRDYYNLVGLQSADWRRHLCLFRVGDLGRWVISWDIAR